MKLWSMSAVLAPIPILSSTALLLTRWSGDVATPALLSTSLRLSDNVSGELRARPEADPPSMELQTRLGLTDRDLERDLALSSSSLDLKPDWWSRLVSSLRLLTPFKWLDTLGEVDIAKPEEAALFLFSSFPLVARSNEI